MGWRRQSRGVLTFTIPMRRGWQQQRSKEGYGRPGCRCQQTRKSHRTRLLARRCKMLDSWHQFKICGPLKPASRGCLTWVLFGQRHDGAVFWNVQNFSDVGVATAFAGSETVRVKCMAY